LGGRGGREIDLMEKGSQKGTKRNSKQKNLLQPKCYRTPSEGHDWGGQEIGGGKEFKKDPIRGLLNKVRKLLLCEWEDGDCFTASMPSITEGLTRKEKKEKREALGGGKLVHSEANFVSLFTKNSV